jgi:RNA polymerase sigma factor (sigma-70 family)
VTAINPQEDVTDLRETALLINRIKADDSRAHDLLLSRYYPYLAKFLHNRLNSAMRRQKDTQDIIQDIFMETLPALKKFDYQGIGSFWAYLRQVAMHHLWRTWDREAKAQKVIPLPHDSRRIPVATDLDPAEAAQQKEDFQLFEQALAVLNPKERDIIFLRIELGLSYRMIANEVQAASPDAVRKACARALEQIYWEMHRVRSSAKSPQKDLRGDR